MKLKEYRVHAFRSVWDSGTIEVDERKTCLVGKNEAGKTALLHALYRTNPIIHDDGIFNPTYDYPKREVGNYSFAMKNDDQSPAVVVYSKYELDSQDIQAIQKTLGNDVLKSNYLSVSTSYGNHCRQFSVDLDDNMAKKHLANSSELSASLSERLVAASNWSEFLAILDGVEHSSAVARLTAIVKNIDGKGLTHFVCDSILKPLIPKFLYFDEYYLIRGQENIDSLLERIEDDRLRNSDHPLIGLINLARLDLDELRDAVNTIELKNKLQNASNYLNEKIMKYWSQNKHIKIQFDVRDAKSEDPEGMKNGVNIWAEIFDTVHWASTPFGSRSRGFIWFFSFLAWYEDQKHKGENLILLLDEPGLSLHGRAQGDLLRYFDDELTGHQLIYTTHSPFMVDPKRLDEVRIVQDRGIDADHELPKEDDGTKVFTDILEATGDTLFPLQGALGYEIQQTLFVGPNCLLVEGPSDLLVLQCVSSQFERERRTSLSNRWVITPVGGSGRVSAFAALLSSQTGINVVALLDFDKGSQNLVESLYRKKLLKKRNVRTYAEFLDQASADLEDLFERDFYLSLVNFEFSSELVKPIGLDEISKKDPRILRSIEGYLKVNPDTMNSGMFNHFRPARYFSEHINELWDQISDEVKDRFESIFETLNGLLKK